MWCKVSDAAVWLLTGVSMVSDDEVISASIDQTVVVWSFSITNDSIQVFKLSCTLLMMIALLLCLLISHPIFPFLFFYLPVFSLIF